MNIFKIHINKIKLSRRGTGDVAGGVNGPAGPGADVCQPVVAHIQAHHVAVPFTETEARHRQDSEQQPLADIIRT